MPQPDLDPGRFTVQRAEVRPADFPDRAEPAFADLVGPFVVPRAGRFVQWERAPLLARTLPAFCR